VVKISDEVLEAAVLEEISEDVVGVVWTAVVEVLEASVVLEAIVGEDELEEVVVVGTMEDEDEDEEDEEDEDELVLTAVDEDEDDEDELVVTAVDEDEEDEDELVVTAVDEVDEEALVVVDVTVEEVLVGSDGHFGIEFKVALMYVWKGTPAILLLSA